MNNRLKFRAWDKLAKQFTYPDKGYQGHYVLTLNGQFQNLQNGSGGDEYVVQQSTGIKDCKGVEIYEGDRIEFYSKDRKIYYYGEIDFTEGAFLVKIVGNEGTLQWFWMYHLNDYEQIRVVGNIFQLPCNPDHNGECLVCDCWLSDCPFLNKEPEYHLSPKNLEWLKQKDKAQEELQKKINKTYDPMWQKPLSTSNPIPDTW
jgi:hypothetical protein